MSIDQTTSPEQIIDYALGFSRYAQRAIAAQPAHKDELLADLYTPFSSTAIEDAFAACTNQEQLKKAARLIRQRIMLRLIVRDLAGLAILNEVFETISSLAELSIMHMVQMLAKQLSQQHGNPVGSESGANQQLIVVAMGKLGGRELNVSSDVDLIFVYPEDGETNGSKTISNHEFFYLLGRKLIAGLSEITEDGYVFRVDMRLRPNGESGALVSSFAALENYYQSQGREWERYAWIKGRPLPSKNSSNERGEELMRLIRPFIYRKYLDYGAFASMRGLHAEIRKEVSRRDLSNNIKLGPGGIREIEFSAQVFQLIRGGRDSTLQARPTLTVLELLAKKKLLSTQACTELNESYVFLRNLEHRLQYLEDQQTQTLPSSAEDQILIAESMGYVDYANFLAALDKHRTQVTWHFEQIFAGAPNGPQEHTLSGLWQDSTETAESTQSLAALGYGDPPNVMQRIKDFKSSRRYNELSASGRHRLDTLMPKLLESAAQFDKPEQTLERLLRLMEHIIRRASYLALLQEYPQTLDQVAKLCSASPWAADYLTQHPILLDELLDPNILGGAPDWNQLGSELQEQLASADQDIERQMDILRHFKQTQTFRLLIQDLSGLLPLETLSDHLSDLACLILQSTLQLCWQNLRSKHREVPQFAIIAYGKLGGKELGYASDLDLIFLYDDEVAQAPETYAKLAQRVNTWLSSYTPAGILYETDLRLRPNGASGLLVSTVAAFNDYQKTSAWVWEHQALTRARWVAGHKPIGQAFEQIRKQVLQQPRDLSSLRTEIISMREKMHAAHPNPTHSFDIKHDAGGIIDVEFIVQYLVLAFSHQYAELTGNIGNIALLKLAAKLQLIPSAIAEESAAGYREYRRWQHSLRLQGERYARVKPDAATQYITPVKALWEFIFNPKP